MPRQILLVDDSVTIHRVVEITFAREDYILTTAKSVDEGLARARELRPDIVLADVGLPGKSGYDLCAALRADGQLGDTTCLLLTGNFSPYDEQKGTACGADGWVVKPFETQALVDKVADAIAKRGGRSAAGAASPSTLASSASPNTPAAGALPVPPAPASPPTFTAPRSVSARQTMIGVAPIIPPMTMREPEAVRPASAPPIPRPIPTTVSRIPVPVPALGAAATPPPPPVIIAPPPPASTPTVVAPPAPAPRVVAPSAPAAAAPPPTAAPKLNALPTDVPQMPRPSMIPHLPTPSPRTTPVPPAPARPNPRATLMGIPAVSGSMMPPSTIPLPPKPAAAWAPPVQKPEVTSPLGAPREAGAPVAPIRDNPSPLMTAVTERASQVLADVTSARGADYEAIAQLSKEVIERIVWEVVPELAETIIKEQLDRLVRERQSL